MTFGTLTIGLGISSAMCAPASVPINPYALFNRQRMKSSPLLSQPVELVVSPKTQAALWKSGLAQARTVQIVTTRDVKDKYTAYVS